jgi:hypothetical protein
MASRWALLGIIAAGSLTVGSCAGALAGNFTVTGGLYPGGGWGVPNFGAEEETAHLPPAEAKPRAALEPQFAGYYPAAAPIVSTAEVADTAARDFAALYDEPAYREEPVYREAVHVEPAREPEPEQSEAAPAEDRAAYWETVADDPAEPTD